MANRIQKHAYVCKIYVCKIWFPFHFKKKKNYVKLQTETHVDDILGMYLVTASRRMQRKICKSIFSPGFSCKPRRFALSSRWNNRPNLQLSSFQHYFLSKVCKISSCQMLTQETKLIFLKISPSLRSEYFNG